MKGERLSCGCVLGEDYRFLACSPAHRETIVRLMKERLEDLRAMAIDQGMPVPKTPRIKVIQSGVVVPDPAKLRNEIRARSGKRE